MTHYQTGNTNKSRFELYALLGEVFGSGCPLGYLLIQSDLNHAKGADGKQKYLEAVLRHFRLKWLPDVIATLSDKDRIEINAFLSQFPEAKHQLCFWHALRAIKTHLSILRRRPAPYNGDTAHRHFSFIDPKFVPLAQMDPSKTKVC